MKIYMLRKVLEDGTKEYASAGLSFSKTSSKGWGRIGNLKNAIKNRLYSYKAWQCGYNQALIDWVEWENRNQPCVIEVLEVDIDNVSITTTEITEWYRLNMEEK